MAGLFSLGGGGGGGSGSGGGGRGNQEGENQNEIPPPETLFWYNKNDDVSVASYRGLELWNQHQQQQQHQHHQHEVIAHARPLLARDLYASGAALGVGVGPSRVSSDDHSSSRSAGFMAMRSSSVAGGEGSGGSGGGISCQDCGNQAKKDCPHMRCRTCCKSRGFDCQTHVKSTWVPASRRRERQQQQQQLTSLQRDISKRPRDLANIPTSSSALRNFPSGLEATNFPAVVSSPAEFKCVRVSSVDDADERYAYQTAVNIGGHVFKGILYDFGPESSNSNYNIGNYMVGETSSAGAAAAQPLNLIADSNAAAGVAVSSSGTLVDPSSMYSAPINAFMTGSSGTQFFPRPRS